VEAGVRMIKKRRQEEVEERAKEMVNEVLLDSLLHASKPHRTAPPDQFGPQTEIIEDPESGAAQLDRLRERYRRKLEAGELEAFKVEIEVPDSQPKMVEIFSNAGIEEMGVNLQDMLGNIMPRRSRKKSMTVAEARRILSAQEAEKLIDMEAVTAEAITLVEQSGIIFIDEIDKIAVRTGGTGGGGQDVSREGVQRDILPIIEGSTVVTKYGPCKTDYILFIAAGAFSNSKPSDLIPELQGRFPLRVELESLSTDDFKRILTEPRNALIKQYVAMMRTDGVELDFTADGINEIASAASRVNQQAEDIGARRLHTLIEKVLEDISFNAPDSVAGEIKIDKNHVQKCLKDIVEDVDLSRYIL
jgi:ATP-dependent HslUV protease ATP-binding subunit HslU